MPTGNAEYIATGQSVNTPAPRDYGIWSTMLQLGWIIQGLLGSTPNPQLGSIGQKENKHTLRFYLNGLVQNCGISSNGDTTVWHKAMDNWI